MTTLAEVRNAATFSGATFADHATPEGHFGITVTIMDIATVYLFEGQIPSPDAVVKGRVELPSAFSNKGSNAYAGNGIKGGEFLGTHLPFAEAFSKMV